MCVYLEPKWNQHDIFAFIIMHNDDVLIREHIRPVGEW